MAPELKYFANEDNQLLCKKHKIILSPGFD